MRAYPIQKPFLIAVAITFLAAQAQAETLCSGAGIYEKCWSESGHGYLDKNHTGTTAQSNGNAKAVDRWYHHPQTIGNATYNQGTFGTSLNTGRNIARSQITNGINQNLQNMQK